MNKPVQQLGIYQIGEFSRISQISIKALRHYQDLGLLKPSYIDETTGYRYYNEVLLERAKEIKTLRSFEFSLQEISQIFADMKDEDDLLKVIKQKSMTIERKIKKLKNIQTQLNFILTSKGEVNMQKSNSIIEVNIPDQLIASIRFKGMHSEITQSFKKIFKAAGMQVKGKPGTLYYDESYKETDAEMECYVPVKKETNKSEVTSRVLKGGKGYSLNHVGPYKTISKSYKKFIDYFSKNNIPIGGPSREIYHKGPGMIFKGNPDKYVTEIQFIKTE